MPRTLTASPDAAQPAGQPRRAPPAGARLLEEGGEVAGAEADQRVVRSQKSVTTTSPSAPVAERPPVVQVAHLHQRVVGDVQALAGLALVAEVAGLGRPVALADDGDALLEPGAQRGGQRLGGDQGALERSGVARRARRPSRAAP